QHPEANKSQNLSIGYRVPGDRLVLNQSVVQHNSHPKVIVIEKSFNIKANERLTLVQSLNQHTDGNGASVSLVRGGPGHNTVTLLFESQIGHGINHVVELYAR
ncbi:putative salivary secreted peptide-like protein, partial [Lasius niger]